jgi:CBS domain-containing protein
MSRPVQVIRLDTPLAVIMENMRRFGRRALPVADEQGKIQGLVTVFDVFKSLIRSSPDNMAASRIPAEAAAVV